MRLHVMPILICYLNNISFILLRPNLLDKREELRKKISRMMYGKQGNQKFLNIDEYEYPRINNTLRQIHKQQWLDYYRCLREAYAETGHERIVYPNALIALEGTSVTLKCRICVSPMEMHTMDLIRWYFNSSTKSNVIKSTLEDMDHIISSSDNQYIVMYNVKSEQAGVYWCEIGDTVGSAYYLYIDSDIDETDIVHPDTVTSIRNLPEYDSKIYITWTKWSECSTCDVVGTKLRYGYCTISLMETFERNERFIVDESTTIDESRYTMREVEEYEWNKTIETTTQTTIVNESVRIQLRMALSLFKNKLPCKSRLVPQQIWMIPAVKDTRIAIMRRYCKKKCRKNMIFQVRDEKGNVLESANNSAGIYSMIQGMPELLPSVMRNVVYEKRNRKAKLICPGNLNTDVPILWQIGDKKISSSYIERQSNGRIRINPQMHIIIQSLRFEDANIYSCWQNNEVAGIIKLNVIGEIEFRVNHHIILIGAILVISVFLIIFWRAFKGRTRYTIH